LKAGSTDYLNRLGGKHEIPHRSHRRIHRLFRGCWGGVLELATPSNASLKAVATSSVTAAGIATANGGEDTVTAFAGGGQGSATALSSTVTNHRVTTVATAGDSVKLPAATVGQQHYVRNDGAAVMQVFGQATETINGVASATGVAQGVGMGVWYICTTAGAWTTSPVSTFVASSGAKGVSLSHNGTNGILENTTNTSGALIVGNGNPTNHIFNNGGGVAPAWSFQGSGTLRFAITSGVNGIGTQLRTAQATVPTCSTNCGTSPSVAGTDAAGIVTMGSSGSPASAWVVTFNGTWASAPSCIVQSALATMVVGKMPIAVVTTTTTLTVTTNGTAPSTSDKYTYICIGVS
jgi:hypothetical protein